MDETTRKKIEQRAYDLFVKRGGANGYHMEDWLKAEREITTPTPKSAVKTVVKTIPAAPKLKTSVPKAIKAIPKIKAASSMEKTSSTNKPTVPKKSASASKAKKEWLF